MISKQNLIKKFAILLIAAVAIIAYANSFENAFQFDDGYHIVDGRKIKNFNSYLNLDYWDNIQTRPLSFFTLAVNYKIHKLDVTGYHVVNLIFHILAGFFAFLFIYEILSLNSFRQNKTVKDYKVLIALFSAFIFIAHPIQTQAVTYIIQRMTVMAGMFYLLSLFLYVLGRKTHLNPENRKLWLPYAYYAGAVVASGLGLLSKQIAVTIPLAWILVEVLFVRNAEGKTDRKFLVILSSLVGFFIVAGIITVGIPVEFDKISRTEYLYTQFRVLVKYWQLLFLPVNQHLDYYWGISSTLWGYQELLSLAFILATLALAVILARKNWTIPAFGIIWFYLVLSIESSIIPIRDAIFEHRLYLAVLGFAFPVSYLAFYFLGGKKWVYPVTALLILTGVYTGASLNRNAIWKTPYSLWNDSVKKSPKRERAWYWLASHYTQQRDMENALRCYNKSVECNPNFPLAYNGRGNLRKETGDLDGAMTDYDKAIELDPRYVTAYYNRGIAHAAKNQMTSAVNDYTRSIKLGNRSAAVRYNRGNAYRRKGMYKEAINDYTQAIRIDSRYPLAYFNRGLTRAAMKEHEAAIKDIDLAIALDPNNHLFYNGKGVSLLALQDYTGAISNFDRTIQLNPAFGQAYNNRGYAKISATGDVEGACADFKTALEKGYKAASRNISQYCD